CLIEDTRSLEAEIVLSEQDAARVATGQRCWPKARALPFEMLWGTVEQIAPAATASGNAPPAGAAGSAVTMAAAAAPGTPGAGAIPSTIIVRTRLDEGRTELRPGMSGFARVGTGKRPIGGIALNRLLRFIRTEFWW